MQLKLPTLGQNTGDLPKSGGDTMPPIGFERYCQIGAVEQIELK